MEIDSDAKAVPPPPPPPHVNEEIKDGAADLTSAPINTGKGPDSLPNEQDLLEGATAKVEKLKSDRIDRMEENDDLSSHDSISFSSTTYLSDNTSYTRKSVSRANGSLDVNKLMNWSLPKLDTSMLPGNKGGHKNLSFNPSAEATAVSTPVLIAQNLDKFRRCKKSTKMEYGSGDERVKMRALMNKMLKK